VDGFTGFDGSDVTFLLGIKLCWDEQSVRQFYEGQGWRIAFARNVLGYFLIILGKELDILIIKPVIVEHFASCRD